MRRRIFLGLLFTTCATALAQDTKPAGTSVPSSFRSYIVVDERYAPKSTPIKSPEDRDPRDRTDKMHCLVCEQGLNAAAIVFTRATPAEDAPATKLIRQLDPVVKDFRANSFSASAIFLTLDAEYPADSARNEKGEFLREGKAKQVRDLATAIKTTRLPLGLAAKASPTATEWGIADADETVVVLYNKMAIVKRWNFPAGGPSDAEIKTVIGAVRAEAGK